MAELIDELLRQNEWASLRLLEACRALSEAQLDATEVGSYGSIRGTLVHYIGAESRYIQVLGGTPARLLRSNDPWPGFDELERLVRAYADGLIERARTVREAFPFEEDGVGYLMEPSVMFAQALNHSTEHRGQICTILTSIGVQPPDLDGWTWAEATDRLRPASS